MAHPAHLKGSKCARHAPLYSRKSARAAPDACWMVLQVHRRLHLVDVLAARTASSRSLERVIFFVQLHIHLIGFRHDCHGGRGRVYAALVVCRWHALHPVHTCSTARSR